MLRIKDWIVDLLYAAYGATKMYIYRKPPKHYLDYVIDGKNPVIIIPGYLARWAVMKSISDDVSKLGHPVYVLPHLGNNMKDIPSSAKIVYDLISEKNLKNVIIVGHSKGGLIGKYLMVHFDKDQKVVGMITIGTPHMGSNLASYFKFIKSNEFHPTHQIIKELTGYPEVNKRIITISASFDNFVWHENKTILNGALDNLHVAVAGHNRLIFDNEVKEKVIASIEKLSKV